MNDRWKIVIGLILFLMVLSFPIWYNFAGGKSSAPPEMEIATKDIPGKDKCLLPAEEMRATHMDVLSDWRDVVVREGRRVHTTQDGRKYNMSLTRTCLDCHNNKANFCDRCHNYMGVKPYCWSCHNDPEEVQYGKEN